MKAVEYEKDLIKAGQNLLNARKNKSGVLNEFLKSVSELSQSTKSPLTGVQPIIGEMLLKTSGRDLLHATDTLSELIIAAPEEADPGAVRRMAKVIHHGPKEDGGFGEFSPDTIIEKGITALHGYCSNKSSLIDGEELGLMILAHNSASKNYHVDKKLLTKFQKCIMN